MEGQIEANLKEELTAHRKADRNEGTKQGMKGNKEDQNTGNKYDRNNDRKNSCGQWYVLIASLCCLVVGFCCCVFTGVPLQAVNACVKGADYDRVGCLLLRPTKTSVKLSQASPSKAMSCASMLSSCTSPPHEPVRAGHMPATCSRIMKKNKKKQKSNTRSTKGQQQRPRKKSRACSGILRAFQLLAELPSPRPVIPKPYLES